jgi:hypothetical protein
MLLQKEADARAALAAEERMQRQLQQAAQRNQQHQETMRRQSIEKQQLNERLRTVGKCPQGYSWRREGNGYRCEGGHHYVSDGQL